MKKIIFMRSLLFISSLFVTLISLTTYGQKLRSSLSNLELPVGSTIDNNPEHIKKYTKLLDSFATVKGYKIKSNAEIIMTDLAAFKEKLSQNKFTIIQEGTTDFYTISKDKDKYLTFIKTDYIGMNFGRRSSSFSSIIGTDRFGLGTGIVWVKR
ncbi:MAG TPA: hypothetical protein VKB95_11035 [Chitinophagaceae bacterium]|nr:hypothetical protein [Chitinophagaceae bacterium]